MLVFSKPTITSANFLLDFSHLVPDIKFQQKLAEDVFSTFAQTQSTQTNVPNGTDPNVPRIVFQSDKKSVSISQTRCQLDFNFTNNNLSLIKQLEIFEKNVRIFYQLAVENFKVAAYGQCALVLDILFESESSSEELNKFLSERFFKPVFDYPIASAQFALGMRVGDFFVNFNAQVVENRMVELGHPGAVGGSVVHVRVEDMKLISQGVSFRFEVNNKPNAKISCGYVIPENPNAIFDEMTRSLKNDFPLLSGLNLYE